MKNELTKEEELAELLMQSTSVQASVILLTEYADQQSKKEAIAFGRWANIDYRWIESYKHWRGPDGETYTDDELYQLYCSDKLKSIV